MNGHEFSFADAQLTARPSGALYWSAERCLAVSDLHLGKSDRSARRNGVLLPPYEGHDTLLRLEAEVAALDPTTVICLGDSFDDLAAARDLDRALADRIATLIAGRRWIWIEGNHDAGPVGFGGTHLSELRLGPLQFRHIAVPGAAAEVSGHYHPKASVQTRARRISRRCFLYDGAKLILPAFGTYTGGLASHDPALGGLMAADAKAILLTDPPLSIPMPRR